MQCFYLKITGPVDFAPIANYSVTAQSMTFFPLTTYAGKEDLAAQEAHFHSMKQLLLSGGNAQK